MEDLQAGRGLDIRVAKEVLHYQVKMTRSWGRNFFVLYGEAGQRVDDWHLLQTEEEAWKKATPHFSTDVAAAWQIVEHIVANKSGEFRLIHRQTYGPEPQFAAGFGKAPCEEPKYILGETGPLAICRAALKAVEAEKKAGQ